MERKEQYRFFEVKDPESVKNLEKMAKEGQIQRIYPLSNIKSIMHLYKTNNGFNIASYLHEDNASIEISRYSNHETKMQEIIDYIKKNTKMEFIE